MAKKTPKQNIKFTLERVPTGIPRLDEMLEGGLLKHTITLLRGASGSGKTLICLQYLHEGVVKYDEPGVYISFAEPEEAVYQHGRMFGWDLQSLVKKNEFAIIRYEPHEVVKIMQEGGGLIRDTIESIGAKRLVIDSLSAYEILFENEYRRNESVLELFAMLRKWGTTSMVTNEVSVHPGKDVMGRVGFLTDAIIHLYYLPKSPSKLRALEVLKMRDTMHDDQIRQFNITREGISVCKGKVPPKFTMCSSGGLGD
jgi:circadian clock protein KaiC